MSSDLRQLELRATILDGGLVAEIVVEPGTDPARITPALVVAGLMQVGVEVRDPTAAQYAEAACAARLIVTEGGKIVAAKGVAPEHGGSGSLRFADNIDPTADGRSASLVREVEPAAANKASPRAGGNHYDRSVFLLVTPGQHVATVILPTSGTEGRDVRGAPLACKIARSVELKLDGTLELNNEGVITAKVDGILCWDEPRLYLLQDIDIPGCVDFSTGKVTGPRDVRVRKSVRSGFSVSGKRDVRVDGVVEAATLSVGRDARLDSGMAAKEKGRLTAARDVWAKYLNNVTATAGRDLEVECEMVNCQLSVGRGLRAAHAAVAGGSITVGGAAEIGVLGSDSAKTSITLGSLPALVDTLATARKLLPRLQERSAKAEARLTQIKNIKGKLSHAQAEELTELEYGNAEAKGKSEQLSARIAKLCEVLTRLTTVELVVHDQIYAKTMLYADEWVADFHTGIKGPVKIELAPNGKLQLTDLQTKLVVDLAGFAKVKIDTAVVPFRGKAA